MSSVAVATSALRPPSQFSALLRRSKFASFDPAVAQVYHSYDAEAYRGNWGLKRPVPFRRRNGMITVSAVDSRYQQTEWSSGQNQARMIKKFEELDVNVQCDVYTSDESTRRWQTVMESSHDNALLDTGFAPPSPENDNTVRPTSPTPNVYAMSNKQFRRYLSKLRKLRPQFQTYLHGRGALDPQDPQKTMYALAQTKPIYVQEFISQHSHSAFHSRESRNIEPCPHYSAGLVYSHTSALQTSVLVKRKSGILLHRARVVGDTSERSKNTSQKNILASFAGTVAGVQSPKSQNHVKSQKYNHASPKMLYAQRTATGIDHEAAKSSVVPLQILYIPRFARAPIVVGRRRRGLFDTSISMQVGRDDRNLPFWFNPHPPGSAEYISMFAPATDKWTVPAYFPEARAPEAAVRIGVLARSNLLGTLGGIITKAKIKKPFDQPSELPSRHYMDLLE